MTLELTVVSDNTGAIEKIEKESTEEIVARSQFLPSLTSITEKFTSAEILP